MDKNFNSHKKSSSVLPLLPLILISCVIPFIVYFKEYDAKLTNFVWFSETGTANDFFLFYKQWAFVLITCVMIGYIIYQVASKKVKIVKLGLLIPLLLYTVLVILSSVVSENRYFSFIGSFEQFENLFVYVGYTITIIYSIIIIKEEEQARIFMKCFTISLLIMAFIGLSQAFGLDFIQSPLGKKLILPSYLWDQVSNLNFNFTDVYLTLYNPNYAGVYIAIVLPILFIIAVTSKNKKEKLYYALLTLIFLIILYFTGSSAGMITTVSTIPFILYFLRPYYSKFINIKRKYIVPILLLLIICVGSGIFLLKDTIRQVGTHLLQKDSFNLEEIITDEKLTIKYKGNSLVIDYGVNDEQFEIIFTDQTDEVVETTLVSENNSFIIEDTRFNSILVAPIIYGERIALKVTIDNNDWHFTKESKDSKFYIINKFNKLDTVNVAPSSLFTDYGTILSGRGFIWSRSLPLIKDNIILGTGIDTFILNYPHDDYVALSNYGFSHQLVTKPHSMYLQVATQSGLLSLIALLVFFTMYLIWSFKLYYKSQFESYFERLGLAIFISTIAFLVVSIANDSMISVSPMFYCLLGIGISINYNLKIKTLDK